MFHDVVDAVRDVERLECCRCSIIWMMLFEMEKDRVLLMFHDMVDVTRDVGR